MQLRDESRAHNGLLLRTFDVGGTNSSAVRPNLVRAPVAVTSATASPRRTSAPAKVSNPAPASAGTDSPVSMDWSSSTEPSLRRTSAATTAPSESFTKSPGTSRGSGYGGPNIIATDECVQREPRLQRGESRLGASFPEESERGIEGQQKRDNRGLDILAEDNLEYDRRLEHPGNRRPELASALGKGCRVIPGTALGPNVSNRRRASSLVRPVETGAF